MILASNTPARTDSMTHLTENHQLLLEKHRSGTRYRQVLAELRHRNIDAAQQAEMWEEIAEVVARCVTDTEPSTITKLLNR